MTLPSGYSAAHVLAGAYRGRGKRGQVSNLDGRTLLVHTVEIDKTNNAVRTVCSISLDSLVYGPEELGSRWQEEPTCPRCQKKLAAIRETPCRPPAPMRKS